MCGICGQFHFDDHTPVLRHDIEKMTRTLAHRGPDDEGYYLEGPVGLGFRRLSIIDLKGGHQPMSDREGSVYVVFNGEIYNFPELKRELQSLGHTFQSKSDTEVIVNGYKQWGDDVFNHLNGMFGLAIWDARQKRLILARDPFGIKLVYYRIEGGRLYFGSEIRAVVAATDKPPEVDPASLNLFLRYRYTPSPYTIYKDVFKLAPGTLLTLEKGHYTARRWYRYKPVPFSPEKSVTEVRQELLELYKAAVKRHLLSDVPVGLLLSGGVDSGLLLALMSLYGKSWRTYTAGYGESFSDDELVSAEDTACTFSSQHQPVMLDPETFSKALPKIVSSLEEPIASASVVPMYFVCERARADVKVALMGQGPDELFGGYRRHLGVQYGAHWANLPKWVRGAAAHMITALPRSEALKRGVYSLDIADQMRRYQHVLSLVPGDKVDELFHDGVIGKDTGDKILSCWQDFSALASETDELGRFQFLELRSTLPDELLMYADKLSMAHSLEVRVPYLDREIVEYVERLPAKFKVRYGTRKWIHREVCRAVLPKRILTRKKLGFAVNVVDDWFRSPTRTHVEDMLRDEQAEIYHYLRPQRVQQMLSEHKSGQQNHYKLLFSLVLFEQWLRNREYVAA